MTSTEFIFLTVRCNQTAPETRGAFLLLHRWHPKVVEAPWGWPGVRDFTNCECIPFQQLFVELLIYERRLLSLVVLVIFATSIWAAIDSDRVDPEATEYGLHCILSSCSMRCIFCGLSLVVCSKIREWHPREEMRHYAATHRAPDR
jgi:hypothetical protein